MAENRGKTVGPGAPRVIGDEPENSSGKPSGCERQPRDTSLGPSGYQITLGRDTIVTLTQATALVPPRRRGRKTSVSTFFRWSTNGCRGLILPTLQCGGTRCTSVEALQWFFEALGELSRTPGAKIETAGVPVVRSPSQRQRASENAGKLLEQMGA
ncbi:MAG: DUF1580 domain-containing protein [Isosphaeraceae bacterium]